MLSGAIELLGADMDNIQLLDPTRGVLEIVAQRGFGQEFLDFSGRYRRPMTQPVGEPYGPTSG